MQNAQTRMPWRPDYEHYSCTIHAALLRVPALVSSRSPLIGSCNRLRETLVALSRIIAVIVVLFDSSGCIDFAWILCFPLCGEYHDNSVIVVLEHSNEFVDFFR